MIEYDLGESRMRSCRKDRECVGEEEVGGLVEEGEVGAKKGGRSDGFEALFERWV